MMSPAKRKRPEGVEGWRPHVYIHSIKKMSMLTKQFHYISKEESQLALKTEPLRFNRPKKETQNICAQFQYQTDCTKQLETI
jgi:hypothetical protein